MSSLHRPILAFALLFMAALSFTTAAEVRIETAADGSHHLLRDGESYLAKGANWPTPETVEALAKAGGNSIRTYANEVEWMLPLARKHSLTVMLGLHLDRERQGFDYANQAAVDEQFERIRYTVRRYKNEPEVLVWAIGNEPELLAKNPVPMWKEVNRIARMIREEDPHHPIITVVAGFDKNKIQQLLAHCPDLDALGVNWYGPADTWPQRLHEYGWTKPYFHTEFGPYGYWENAGGPGRTPWGASIEQTSTEKAALYRENWSNAVSAHPGRSLGGYCFIWGPKQERTHTWFSMHLFSGERTEMVDAMHEAWTGEPPANPAPRILEWKSAMALDEYQPGENIQISLRWESVRPATLLVDTRTETTSDQVGGDPEPVPKTQPHTEWKTIADGLEVTAPSEPGKYRVFLLIKTEDQTVATANLPILVQ